MMMSFYYYNQNPSAFAFLCRFRILLFKPHWPWDYQILNMKEETKWVNELVKRHHCANGLLKLWSWFFKCMRSEAVHILLYSSCYFSLLVLCIPWRETESALPKHVVFQGNAFWCILSDHFYKLLCIYFFILWFRFMKFILFIIIFIFNFPRHIMNQFNL